MTGAADAVLRIAYRIQPSLIAGAGQGLFADPELLSSVHWFEEVRAAPTSTRTLLRILENAA